LVQLPYGHVLPAMNWHNPWVAYPFGPVMV